MPKVRTAAAGPSRLSVKRSVWGCLTCRRRKVKCLDREMPCSACTRLKLTCVPSFNGNFKLWKREHNHEDDARSSAKPEAGQRQKPLPLPQPMPSYSQPKAGTAMGGTAAAQPPSQPHNPFGVFDARMPGPQTNASQVPLVPTTSFSPTQSILMMNEWSIQQPSPFDLDMPMSFLFGGAPITSIGDAYTPTDFYGPPSFVAQAQGASGGANGAVPPIEPQSSSPPQDFMYSGIDAPPETLSVQQDEEDNADTVATGGELVVLASRAQSPALSASSIGDDDSDRSLVVYYRRNLSSFFSVKSYPSSLSYTLPTSRLTTISALSAAYSSNSSPPDSSASSHVPVWNFYSYAIRAAEEQPDSPLSHSILAWTSAHLILRNRYTSDGHAQFRHYARARAAVDELRDELMSSRPSSHKGTKKQGTPPLRMFLATTLFLAYGDILSGDCAGLVESLSGVTQMLASDWPRFRAELGPIEARILVWLSYLDLRARMWAPPPRTDKKHKSSTGSGNTSLFNFLQAHNGTLTTSGISALRAHHRDGATSPESDSDENQGAVARRSYYLTECFGSALPARELEEDLLQEPAKMLSDEIMGVYATISTLEGWIAGIDWDEDQNLLMDLRNAKIQAIRANIARIHAESKVVHADLMKASSGADHVARTTFHRLVTTAKTLAATVLLNRVQAPSERTDEESQASAREIVQIARQLGHLGNRSVSSSSLAEVPESGGSSSREDIVELSLARLPSVAGSAPHSLVWPMPVFVAGIELTDPVYQDWVLAYLADVASWGGTSTRRARELLRRVIQQQDASGRRVNVRDVVAELGGVLI
ncbi:c6 zinc finger domain containing protein [Ophiostoma piceae UAMH 11346]|uniref:C6 zinc finger domain containing protein n=1 Tax=Ophiostoma piceae (strain UAMH 11346) TaxID=1262450 RepID=S3CD45_OPHP1|nr:c6 zinc finger domain containing protein [Ophiostoma piceae UAMH 11346]